MRITVHRGQNQIGGSIIEISTEATRVVFDVGINLDETECVKIPAVEGLFQGNPLYDVRRHIVVGDNRTLISAVSPT